MEIAILDYPSYDRWYIKKLELKFHGFVPIYIFGSILISLIRRLVYPINSIRIPNLL